MSAHNQPPRAYAQVLQGIPAQTQGLQTPQGQACQIPGAAGGAQASQGHPPQALPAAQAAQADRTGAALPQNTPVPQGAAGSGGAVPLALQRAHTIAQFPVSLFRILDLQPPPLPSWWSTHGYDIYQATQVFGVFNGLWKPLQNPATDQWVTPDGFTIDQAQQIYGLYPPGNWHQIFGGAQHPPGVPEQILHPHPGLARPMAYSFPSLPMPIVLKPSGLCPSPLDADEACDELFQTPGLANCKINLQLRRFLVLQLMSNQLVQWHGTDQYGQNFNFKIRASRDGFDERIQPFVGELHLYVPTEFFFELMQGQVGMFWGCGDGVEYVVVVGVEGVGSGSGMVARMSLY